MKILGISAHYHDSAAALVVDGLPVCAVQEERLSRRKNDAAFPLAAIEWCLEHARPRARRPRRGGLLRAADAEVRSHPDLRAAGLPALGRSFPPRDEELARREGLGARHHPGAPRRARGGRSSSPSTTSRHAAAAFLTAPTRPRRHPDHRRRRRVGDADRRPRRAARRAAADIILLREIRFPHSLGMLYSTFTAYLGFAVNEGEYKVMGLAAYGRPTMAERGAPADPPDRRRRLRARPRLLRVPHDRHAARIRSASSTSSARRAARTSRSTSTRAEGRRFADFAASVQLVLEETLVDIARALHRETGLPDLCLGGGVALNGVANARILAESGFERVFVPPAPGDAGCALGAALYADRIHFGNPDRDVPDHPFWGPAVERRRAGAAGARGRPAGRGARRCRAHRTRRRRPRRRPHRRLDGRRAASSGPRALGHRSILAAPHAADDARPAQPRHQVPRGVPALRAGRAARGGRPLLRAAARRRAAGALHVRRVPGAAGVARRGWPR